LKWQYSITILNHDNLKSVKWMWRARRDL